MMVRKQRYSAQFSKDLIREAIGLLQLTGLMATLPRPLIISLNL